MGSVLDLVECDKCGGVVHVDYKYNTQEIRQICDRCGRTFSDLIKRDKDGKFIFKDKDRKEVVRERKQTPGNGIAHLIYTDGVGGLYAAPEDIDKYNEWFTKVLKEINTSPQIDKESCYVTKWDYEKNKLLMMYGEIKEKLIIT